MDYNLKIVINGVEVLEDTGTTETGGVTYVTPSITGVTLQNSASQGAMDIGATASDKLTLTMLNPYKNSFDGDAIEFYIEENETDESATLLDIAEDVGDDTTDAGIDMDENDSDLIEDEEEGEDLTAEEVADVNATNEINEEDLYTQLEGETDTTTPDENIESGWLPMGVYYVMNQQSNSDGSITITAYDGFSKMNGFYVPTNSTGTVQSFFDDLKAQTLANCGIVIDDYEFDELHNIQIDWTPLTTYRNAIGFLAGIVGGFAEFDENGHCGISFYTFTSNELVRGELLNYVEDSAGEMVLQEITCNIAINGTEELTSGAGQGIAFKNPFITQELLDDVLNTYNGMRFVGGTMSAIWDRSLVAGQFVRVFTEEEYRNYVELSNAIDTETDPTELLNLKSSINALGSIMLIGSQVIDFNGNATTTITSGNGTEASKTNAMTPPVIQRVIEAGKTATNYLNQDSTGALVVSNNEDDGNVRIDSDSVDIRNGERVLASFGERVEMYNGNSKLMLAGNTMVVGIDGEQGISEHRPQARMFETVIEWGIETLETINSVSGVIIPSRPDANYSIKASSQIESIITLKDGNGASLIGRIVGVDGRDVYLSGSSEPTTPIRIVYVPLRGGVRIDDEELTDFIIENYEVDGWNCEKWYSGKMVAYKNGITMPARTGAVVTSPVRHTSYAVTLPSIFNSIKYVNVSSENGDWWDGGTSAITTTSVTVELYKVTSTSLAGQFSLHIIGTWK